MNIKGAIFDMDGTLVDSLGFWDDFWAYAGDKYLNDATFKPDNDTMRAITTMLLKDAAVLIHTKYGVAENPDVLLDEFNNHAINYYKNKVVFKKGALEFIEYCKENGIKMCIASATAMDLIKIVDKKLELNKYFEKIVSCADVGKGKDHPDVFLAALEYVGTSIDETCVFEDSFVALETAKKAGFSTVGIFDKNNFCQDKLKSNSDIYIDENETLMKLVEKGDI